MKCDMSQNDALPQDYHRPSLVRHRHRHGGSDDGDNGRGRVHIHGNDRGRGRGSDHDRGHDHGRDHGHSNRGDEQALCYHSDNLQSLHTNYNLVSWSREDSVGM